MTVRQRAITGMMERRYGKQVFDGLRGVCVTMPDYYERREEMAAEYDAIIDSIDWKRVVFEAIGRHMALKHEKGNYDERICGECIDAVMLLEETYPGMGYWLRESQE